MKLHTQQKPSGKQKKAQRRGRGYGSGRGGHTVGRGAKGTKARSKVSLWFEGTKVKKSLLKRLPMQRGKGKHTSKTDGPMIVNVKYLNVVPKNTKVDVKALVKHGVIREKDAKEYGVKILGEGVLEVPLTVLLPCSEGAKKKIEKAGGTVQSNNPQKAVREKEKK